jgi:hypothetical protein
MIQSYQESRADGNGKYRTYTVLEGLSCAPNGTEVWKTLSDGSISGLTFSGATLFGDGSAAAPSLAFASDTDTGFYSAGAGKIGIVADGNSSFASIYDIGQGGFSPIFIAAVRSNGSQTIAFGNSSGTNGFAIGLEATNTLAVRNGTSAQAFRVYNTFTDASNYERGGIKWSSNECQVFTEVAGTGSIRSIGLASVNVINFRPGGTLSWQMTASGHLIAGTDATFDIGASGATRPRNGFFSGTLSYGTFTGNADAPVTGFITITDSGGTTRKLAVIA